MGLFGNIGRGALGWSTGGLSELGRKDPFGLGGGSRSVVPAPWNPMTAQNVDIQPGLAATLAGGGATAAKNIGANYTAAGTRQGQEAATLRKPPSAYGAERLGTAQGLDVGNLESALGGQAGASSYQNALENRDYGQNMTLADQIAALNRPNKLEQIFSGMGAVGKPLATYGGMGGFRGYGRGGNVNSDFTGLI